MTQENPNSGEVDRFVAEEIDSVPHLEALLLVWKHRPKTWTVEEMAAGLYLPTVTAHGILHSLGRRNLLRVEPGPVEAYGVVDERGELIEAVHAAYGRDLVRISRMIHSKASPGVRDFAKAFRFTKDKE